MPQSWRSLIVHWLFGLVPNSITIKKRWVLKIVSQQQFALKETIYLKLRYLIAPKIMLILTAEILCYKVWYEFLERSVAGVIRWISKCYPRLFRAGIGINPELKQDFEELRLKRTASLPWRFATASHPKDRVRRQKLYLKVFPSVVICEMWPLNEGIFAKSIYWIGRFMGWVFTYLTGSGRQWKVNLTVNSN